MIARRERREEGEGIRDRRVGCEEGGEELKADNSVRRRLVGVREEEDEVEVGEERLFADMVGEAGSSEGVCTSWLDLFEPHRNNVVRAIPSTSWSGPWKSFLR